MIRVDWVKMHAVKKAYKHEVLIKISQKARFEKNYIVWKLINTIGTNLLFTGFPFEKNYIVWKPCSITNVYSPTPLSLSFEKNYIVWKPGYTGWQT